MRAAERDAAKKLGLKRYSTGKPCGAGHLADRYTSSGSCVICVKGNKTPEETRTYFNDWQRSNRSKVKVYAKRHRLKRKYGLTIEEFEKMQKAQNGRCKICTDEVDLVIDHDHVTGVVRGLLCHPCNHGLGHFRDSPAALRAAVKYLVS